MYKSFYRLAENPFSLTPDPQFLYLSSVHKRAIAYLNYSLETQKGFSVITGEIGAGKTTVIKAVINRFQDQARVAHIINPSPEPDQLLRMIVKEYEIRRFCDSLSRVELLDLIHGYLLRQYAAGSRVALIIDEAQRLPIQTLEEIRLLSNLETEKEKLIHIILVGQPQLKDLLDSPHLCQLRQRVSLWFHILPLSLKETADYIQHRLKVAGCPRNPFSKGAVRSIFQASGGIPRLINIACDAALLAGYVEQKQTIRAWLVDQVLEELNLKGREKKREEKKSIFSRLFRPRGERTEHFSPNNQQFNEVELILQGIVSLYRSWRQQRMARAAEANKITFPDDLSCLEHQEDVLILSQIISLWLMINALHGKITKGGRRVEEKS